MSTRRFSFWALLGVLALAIFAGAYHLLQKDTELPAAGPTANAAVKPAERVISVEAVPVEIGTVLENLRAVGTLRPNEAVVVSPEIAGRIARLPFSEGEKVVAGAPLVELDSEILQAELAKAEADLTLAAANQKRAMTLAEQGTGTLRARDEAVAAYRSAQANFALAQSRLEKATITAPLSGMVGMRSVSVGAYISPGDRVVELADIDPIKVDFRVPELVLSSLKAGQEIKVTVDALPGETFDGEVYVIDPIVDAGGRAVKLRARIPNPDGRLLPGLFARVQIVMAQRENSVLVPESAVFASGQKRYVYRVVEGRVVQTEVELGQRRPGQVEIRNGLAADAVVVTAGHEQIKNGSRVKIVTPDLKSGKGA
jgi:membrane fusion protein (multidrug efflux system)